MCMDGTVKPVTQHNEHKLIDMLVNAYMSNLTPASLFHELWTLD